MKDIEITNFTINGKCSSCGECCGDMLHLSKKEISTIHKYVKENNIKATLSKHNCFVSTFDNTCPFRDEKERKCKIYEVRPLICRKFTCDTNKWNKDNRDLINKKRKFISLRKEFYNDESNQFASMFAQCKL